MNVLSGMGIVKENCSISVDVHPVSMFFLTIWYLPGSASLLKMFPKTLFSFCSSLPLLSREKACRCKSKLISVFLFFFSPTVLYILLFLFAFFNLMFLKTVITKACYFLN